ncbi:uncharacterized protein LOC117903651 [Drosophila subobscura]|uniref:uncharacterized protein LOC117903651 n=1 Tax=Drosophila subobscura TaxID=7241 RepID=UPI00155A3B3A|nr:uncharacterized protein LOC117903651 [Drosophila subobscura]
MFGKRRRDHERDQERNNNMYHRLCQTLAAEHQKLRDLELRREKLMEELRILRARFMQENALLRRTVQGSPNLQTVLHPPVGPYTSAAACTGASARPLPHAALPGHGARSGILAPDRIPVRSMSFANLSSTISRPISMVPKQVAPRQSPKKAEQKVEQRQDTPGRKSVRFPKRGPAPCPNQKPGSNATSVLPHAGTKIPKTIKKRITGNVSRR